MTGRTEHWPRAARVACESMDLKTTSARALRNACKRFLQDLQALPEDAFSRSLGGTSRTVADIVHEVNLVNDDVGRVIRGEEPFEWPDEKWIKAPADFDTKDVVVGASEKSSGRIIDTIEALSDEAFEATIKTEQGETTRFERCRFVTLHLAYHSGQLNFIQTLLGDDGLHWN